jgi:hypothetical protein
MRSIGVEYGYGSRAELLEAGADMLVKTPAEIVTVLHEITLPAHLEKASWEKPATDS